MNFAYENGTEYQPGIAFTAASVIKIPIMVSIFEKLQEPTPPDAADLLQLMIEQSKNDAADKVMQTYLDPYLDHNYGPIMVTDVIEKLGLENTFLAGYFAPGSILIRDYPTPANRRTDYDTDPDRYVQTTTAEMGMLLDDIYQCAETGGGSFAAVFPGRISQTECQLMVTYLTMNKIAMLLQAGLPDGTKIAHKHGWTVDLTDGLMHQMTDAGIVYSPGGDYVITIAMYQPTQLIFDIANQLTAKISTAVYNYFNISS
jgi:beta-lactamase class A